MSKYIETLIVCFRGCLNATPDFGPLAVPVFLEKLTAGSPSTKARRYLLRDVHLQPYLLEGYSASYVSLFPCLRSSVGTCLRAQAVECLEIGGMSGASFRNDM